MEYYTANHVPERAVLRRRTFGVTFRRTVVEAKHGPYQDAVRSERAANFYVLAPRRRFIVTTWVGVNVRFGVEVPSKYGEEADEVFGLYVENRDCFVYGFFHYFRNFYRRRIGLDFCVR